MCRAAMIAVGVSDGIRTLLRHARPREPDLELVDVDYWLTVRSRECLSASCKGNESFVRLADRYQEA